MSDRPQICLGTGSLGGLGDLLVYSTLAERYAALGFDVYLEADHLARNPEITDLVFAHNPFIKGTSDKKPTIGYPRQGRFYDVANKFPIGSIEAMERAHDLLPPYSLAPKIYYAPKPFKVDLRECVLVDLSAISSTIGTQGVSDTMTKMNDRFPGRQFYQVIFPEGVNRNRPPLDGPAIQMNSIYEYVDAIASCYAWVGSEAGGQALAAAVRGEHDVYDLERRPEIVSVISPRTYNSRGYTFRGVDYRVTQDHSNAGTDYWSPHEVPYERYQLLCRRSVEQARAEWEADAKARAERESASAT